MFPERSVALVAAVWREGFGPGLGMDRSLINIVRDLAGFFGGVIYLFNGGLDF